MKQFFLVFFIRVMYADKSAKQSDQKCANIQKFILDSSRNVPVETPSQAWR
jgi:hypothetical protein